MGWIRKSLIRFPLGDPAQPSAPARGAGRAPSRGIALVAVLWGLVLLSVITLGFVVETRTETRLAFNAVANAQARALGDAGFYRAVLALVGQSQQAESQSTARPQRRPLRPLGAQTDGRSTGAPRIGDQDAADPSLDPLAGATPWRPDGSVTNWRFGSGELWIAIEDEGGKIDLNAASNPLLQSLFEFAGMARGDAEALLDAVIDFRDSDDLRRLNGAERGDYEAAGLDYGPKNAPFELVEELQQVLGMSPRLYEALAPALTVYSDEEGIDPRRAPPEVLFALPEIDRAVVEQYLDDRAAADPLTAPILTLDPAYAIDSEETVFTLRVEAKTEQGARFVREAVVELTGDPDQPFRILDWRRGRASLEEEQEQDGDEVETAE